MFCRKCGTEFDDQKKYCAQCGTPSSDVQKNMSEQTSNATQKKSVLSRILKWVGIFVVSALILLRFGCAGINNLENTAVDLNDAGLENLNSGNTEQAIVQLEKALEEATLNFNKVEIAKNLAYAYDAKDNSEKALEAFDRALSYAAEDSFNHHYLKGEIAYYTGDPEQVEREYLNARAMNELDSQINNALGSFYMDLEELYPEYANYAKALSYMRVAYDAAEEHQIGLMRGNLALAHLYNDNYGEVVSLLDGVTLTNPEEFYLLGLAYANQGNDEKAVRNLEIAINEGVEASDEILQYLEEIKTSVIQVK